MKVLLVTYHYPPDREVGGLRAEKVAKALRAAGHTVEICAAGAVKSARDEEGVRRIRPFRSVRELYADMRAGRQAKTATPDVDNATADPDFALQPQVAAWKRLIFSALWLPDDRQGWIFPTVRYALRRIRNENFDLLYTTAPPFSVHICGLIIKRLTGIRWACEFRDPWTDNPWKPAQVRSSASDAVERWMERACLSKADHIVTVAQATGDVFRSRLDPDQRDRLVVIRNGIEKFTSPSLPTRSSNVIRIVYAGSIYHRRDPRPFLAALSRLRRAGKLESEVSVEFIGNCKWYQGVSVKAIAEEEGIGDSVRFIDWLSHEELARITAGADFVLLLAQDWSLQVPNKLYDYLGSGSRIIAFADANGETHRMLNQVGGHFVITDSQPEVVERVLEEALSSANSGAAAQTPPILKEWSTERQMERLCRHLEARTA